MTRAATLLAASLFAAGCSHHAPAPVAAPDARATAMRDATAFLEDRCNACHDGNEPRRPSLGAAHPLSADLAMRSVMMLSSGRMPLDATKLGDHDRHAGIRLLCEAAAPDPARCIAEAEWRNPAPLVAPPQQILDALARAYPNPRFPPGKQTDVSTMLRNHAANAQALALRIDPTTEILLVALANERCPTEPAGTFEACARFLLAHDRFSPPERTP